MLVNLFFETVKVGFTKNAIDSEQIYGIDLCIMIRLLIAVFILPVSLIFKQNVLTGMPSKFRWFIIGIGLSDTIAVSS